jgi:hypothetical protein
MAHRDLAMSLSHAISFKIRKIRIQKKDYENDRQREILYIMAWRLYLFIIHPLSSSFSIAIKMASKQSRNFPATCLKKVAGKHNRRGGAAVPDQVPVITRRKKNKRTKISKDAEDNQEEITIHDSSEEELEEVELEKEECVVKLLSKLDEKLLVTIENHEDDPKAVWTALKRLTHLCSDERRKKTRTRMWRKSRRLAAT